MTCRIRAGRCGYCTSMADKDKNRAQDQTSRTDTSRDRAADRNAEPNTEPQPVAGRDDIEYGTPNR